MPSSSSAVGRSGCIDSHFSRSAPDRSSIILPLAISRATSSSCASGSYPDSLSSVASGSRRYFEKLRQTQGPASSALKEEQHMCLIMSMIESCTRWSSTGSSDRFLLSAITCFILSFSSLLGSLLLEICNASTFLRFLQRPATCSANYSLGGSYFI